MKANIVKSVNISGAFIVVLCRKYWVVGLMYVRCHGTAKNITCSWNELIRCPAYPGIIQIVISQLLVTNSVHFLAIKNFGDLKSQLRIKDVNYILSFSTSKNEVQTSSQNIDLKKINRKLSKLWKINYSLQLNMEILAILMKTLSGG